MFDLASDLHEFRYLFDDPRSTATVAGMKQRLAEVQHAMDDPLVQAQAGVQRSARAPE